MAVFLPGSPPGYNKDDPTGTVKAVCNYLRTLQENLDFQLTQFKKTDESYGESIASIQATVKSMGFAIKELEAAQEAHATAIAAIGNDMTALENRVLALEQK